jgi:hypothetical protein
MRVNLAVYNGEWFIDPNTPRPAIGETVKAILMPNRPPVSGVVVEHLEEFVVVEVED